MRQYQWQKNIIVQSSNKTEVISENVNDNLVVVIQVILMLVVVLANFTKMLFLLLFCIFFSSRMRIIRVCQIQKYKQKWKHSCLQAMTPQPLPSLSSSIVWRATQSTRGAVGMRSCKSWMARIPWNGRHFEKLSNALQVNSHVSQQLV